MLEANVTYCGIEFEVSGNYVEPKRGTHFEPPEGGYIEDLNIAIGGIDALDVLSSEAIQEIERLATEGRSL